MSWIIYVFAANSLFSVTSILDKYLNSKKIKSVYTYSIILNSVYFIFFAVTAYAIKDTFVINSYFWWAILGGWIYFFMWLVFWKALKTVEVSRASALVFTQPVFIAFLATWFLGEKIDPYKWLAILLIVAGAFASSWEGKKARFNRGYLLVIVSAVLSAMGNVVAKHAMSGLPALTVNTIGFFGTIPLYLALLANKKILKEVKDNLSDRGTLIKFFWRGVIGYGAISFFMLAVGAGPISLVSALSGTQPLFTLALSLATGFFLPNLIKEETSKSAITVKLVAILLIVVGAVIISQ